MSAIVTHTGIRELDDALSYMRERSAPKVAKIGVRRMATVTATGIRKFIPRTIRPREFGSGIGARAIKGATARAKAGVGVGRAAKGRQLKVVNMGVAKPSAAGGGKFARFTRSGRKGVGVSSRNLHWFALGTKNRFTGQRKSGKKTIRTGGARKFTGRIDKGRWGGFVQRGTTATRQLAIAEAAKVMNKAIIREAARGQGGVSVDLGTDF